MTIDIQILEGPRPQRMRYRLICDGRHQGAEQPAFELIIEPGESGYRQAQAAGWRVGVYRDFCPACATVQA